MSNGPPTSGTQRARIAALLNQGFRPLDVAGRVGCPVSTVYSERAISRSVTRGAPRTYEIEPGRSVVNDWDAALFESWAERKARRERERAPS